MSEEKEGKAMVGGWGLIDRGGAAALPRSLHCATRRTQTVREKKPGRPAMASGTQGARSGRDDRKGGECKFFWRRLTGFQLACLLRLASCPRLERCPS